MAGQTLQAALNGDRVHPATPRTPGELAAEARAVVDAGAASVHMHPYDADGGQTLDSRACAEALRAVRGSCPGVPISLSTSRDIEPDPARRRALVLAWTELPDLVTINQGEAGIRELCELLSSRGIGIEAGLLSLSDARSFVASGIASRCVRVLVEPLDADPDDAVGHARPSRERWPRAPYDSSRSTTATAWRHGRSTGAPPGVGTASEPAWRTRPCSLTDGWPLATPSSSRPPRRCCSG